MKKAVKTLGPQELHKNRLLEKRSSVLSGLGIKFDTRARMGRVAEDDQAQLSHDEFVSLRMNGLDYRQLRMVEEALDRMEAGDFGICLACDEPIAEKRLQALPWARYCVKCEEEMGAEIMVGGTQLR
jgi:DnaK suppressor protein